MTLTGTTLSGATLTVNGGGGRVVLNNGRASVEIPDVDASNGVIHVIDNVLLPPAVASAGANIAPTAASTGTIVDVLAGNQNFSTLVAAVQAAGLVDALSARGPFTVFAPTNGAFNTLLSNLGVSAGDLLANRSLLT
ncbi:MAG: fasciclin domain-containing protein, partial [Anaerolineae bacterium]|nr:fasciclin domain-containing protein [Thermoflexales bacterium]MDW8409051.1 fasciclin domain-containing protein [Anaerolineae bacterium]